MKKRASRGLSNVRASQACRLPKLCGADIELGNFILGLDRAGGTGYDAARALLREINGLPALPPDPTGTCSCAVCRARRESPRYDSVGVYHDGSSTSAYQVGDSGPRTPYTYNPQDWGRKFLPDNGGCVYIDLNHLELCLPEVLSAYDHVAAWHAMLRITRRALQSANEKQPCGQKIQVLVNNSDGQGNSYGSHLDFLITRRAWDNIFVRKMHYMLYLAAYQTSSIIFTGQGKVGSENGTPPVEFQLSQRADFLETLTGAQTTFRRPIANSRDEPLCGRARANSTEGHAPGEELARLHVIFFDSTLCHVASLLKVGVMQIVLAMLEAEHVNAGLILDDPLEAVVRWSHDPTLQARARMASGDALTAVELQLLFLEEAKRFAASGGCDGIVPHAGEILALWEDTLLKLLSGDLAGLAPRLDWVLKRFILERVLRQRPELSWDTPQIKHLDHLFSSLDPAEGLYWAYETSGFVERIVTEEQIERFVHEPPEDTRAWTRAKLLRAAGPEVVEDADWDCMRFKTKGKGYWPRYRVIELPNPLAFTRAATRSIFEKDASLDDILDALGATQAGGETGSPQTWRPPPVYEASHGAYVGASPSLTNPPCVLSWNAGRQSKPIPKKGEYDDEVP